MESRVRAIDRQLLVGIAVFRAAAWVWLTVVAAVSYHSMTSPALLWVVVGATGVITYVLLRDSWRGLPSTNRVGILLLGRPAVEPERDDQAVPGPLMALDLFGGVALLVADGWVYDANRPQSLAGVWPVAAILTIAVVRGIGPSLLASLVLGAARFVGQVGTYGSPGSWSGSRWLAVLSTTVLYALAGAAAGYVAARLRAAEDAAADARARERVARDLHDGMLQTLAAVQRRSGDADLVRLARTQEADLRAYLFEPSGSAHSGDVAVALRQVASTATARFGLRVDLAVVPPLPTLTAGEVDALAGAVGEALANIGKHAGVDRANVFAEAADGGVHVVVRDQGQGFDAGAVERRGLDRSVAARLAEVGGSVEVRATPGRGTEVNLAVAGRNGRGGARS